METRLLMVAQTAGQFPCSYPVFLSLHLHDINSSRICSLALKNSYALARPLKLSQPPNSDAAMQTAC